MEIKLTEFAYRHFDKDFAGTRITDITPEKFDDYIKNVTYLSDIMKVNKDIINKANKEILYSEADKLITRGYAPFCKLVTIPNFTNANVPPFQTGGANPIPPGKPPGL